MAQAPLSDKAGKKELSRQSGMGPTEDQVDMSGTIGQRIDDKGTKVEDEAGTGEIDSSGG